MKDFFRNRYFRIVLIIELVILLGLSVKCFMPLASFVLPYSELTVYSGEIVDGQGAYIDNSLGEKGYFVGGPLFNIEKGSYDITINYRTDCLATYVELAGANYNYNSLLMDDFKLNPLLDSETFTVWTDKSVRNFGVSVIYDGTESLLIKDITIKENFSGRIYEMVKLLFGITLLNLVIWCAMLSKAGRINLKKLNRTLVLGAIVLFSSMPLFTTFLTEGDDIVFHLLRIEGLKDGLLAGQFPVRIHPTQFRGYGYANSIFYGELLLYIPALLRLVGFPLQTAYKIFVVLVNVVTALVTYKAMDEIVKNKNVALVCCLVYVLAPYRLTNIYVRSAVGEYCAMIFWPLIAWGLYRLFTEDVKSKNYKNIWVLLTLGYSGVIETHMLSCEIAAAVSVILCLILFKKTFRKETVIELVKFFVMTVVLNAFFLVPFLDYMLKGGITVVDLGSLQTQAIQGNGIYPAQLLNLFVNGSGMAYGHAVYDYKILGMYNEMGTTVGLPLLLALVAFVYILIGYYNEARKEKLFVAGVLMSVAGALAVYMSTNMFPWDSLCRNFGSLVYNLQFPWRMFTVANIFLTVLLGCVLIISRNIVNKVFYNTFVCVIIVTNVITSGFMMYDRLNTSKAIYTYDGTTFANNGSGSLNEYLPTGTNTDELNVYVPVATENVTVTDYVKENTNISLCVTENDGKAGEISLPLLSYMGYKAVADSSEELAIGSTGNNVMKIMIPADFAGEVTISYESVWYWRVAELVTLAGILFSLGMAVKSRRRNADIQ